MERRGLIWREFVRYSVIIGLISLAVLFQGARLFAEEPKDGGCKTGFLEVPGARLYYETIGSGPLMIMVPGANGEANIFKWVSVDLDIDSLKAHADRIVLMVGRESRGTPCYNVNVELGKKLNRDVIEMPGGHGGFASQPAGFAQEFLQALSRTGR